MTREQKILIDIYCNAFGLKFLGTFENNNELSFCNWSIENPKPHQIIPLMYDKMLDFLENNINKIGYIGYV